MYQHFIITRFNLRKKGWSTTQGNTPVLTNEWMDNRLKLFEEYCYSSCLAQDNMNFTWLVFLDIETSEKHREIISSLSSKFMLFTPVYIDGMNAFLPSIKYNIKKLLKQPFLITSRLDNDDCLSKSYVSEVQKQFASQKYMAIDFIDGFTLQLEPQVRVGKHIHMYNPFISLIEKADGFQTVWSRSHGGWGKIKNIKSIRNKPVWLSVIHKENKENRFVGFDKVLPSELDRFNISPNKVNDLKGVVIPYENWKFESLINKLRVITKLYFKLVKHRLRDILRIIPYR